MRIALGTVQFGLDYGIANQSGQVTRSVARQMLQLAAAEGIDTLDTAINYGESESCLGEIGTEGFRIVTKLPAVSSDCCDIAGWINDQVSASLSRLGSRSLYGLLLHRSDQLLGSEGRAIYDALQGLKASGLVEKIGVSIYDPHELDLLIPKFHFDLVQAPFNLVDRRLSESGWLSRLKLEGVEIHTRSAFLQGLLLMQQEAIPSKFAQWSGLLSKWHTWLSDNQVSVVQACLAFPLAFSEIDRVVIGADSVAQLEQIIAATKLAVPVTFPDLCCSDENLINPSRWIHL
ncbi:aldo/keto reductase [Chlorobium phaeovibrioides]|uniref:aldo/keto reductase n=1 Tax=Chlorobium phaeovibrioides TaxID=1094 RepID=UPI000F823790|nr:aldo/keto reductase [Chlorobium phaeovibrioides]RTY34219.1 aldo/keto reductase [Chlorobium phaeovibrioides]